NHFLIKVGRQGFTGPIIVEGDDLPDGVVIPAVTIGRDSDQAGVEVRVSKALPSGEHRLAIKAKSADDPKIRGDIGTVTLRAELPPPTLRLSLSPQMTVYRGGKNLLAVQIARNGF